MIERSEALGRDPEIGGNFVLQNYGCSLQEKGGFLLLAPSCRGRFRQAGRVTEKYRVRVDSTPEETITRPPPS